MPWECAASEAQTLYISPDVSTISATAFMDFKSLREAYLPGVVSIGISAFYMCEKLEKIEMPKVSVIGSSAFERCSSLNQLLIAKPDGSGVHMPRSKFSLPKVMAVGDYAFGNCKKLASINMPLCASIGKYAFMRCESLTEANLPKAAQVGKGAFMCCSKLSKAKIRSEATVGKDALDRSGAYWFEYAAENASDNGEPENNPNALVFFDLETTGKELDSEITEIGAVKVRKDGSVSEYFQTFVKPNHPIPPETVDFNGIDDSMVGEAPTQHEAVESFLEFVNGLPVAGHNIKRFDIPIMTTAYRAELSLSDVTDTLEVAATKEIPGAADNKQTTIYGSALAYGDMEPAQVQGHAHRALYDADVNRIIFSYLQTLELKGTPGKTRRSSRNSGVRQYYSDDYKTRHCYGVNLKECKPTVNPADIDPNNPLYGKHVCITTAHDDRPIWRIVIDRGGIPETNSVRSMDVLIVGEEGKGLNRNGKPTAKAVLADFLRNNGKDVLVIDEKEFFKLFGSEA